MEDTNSITNEQRQTRSHSPSITPETIWENAETFDRLQKEMATLKALMDKLLEQNGERNRQVYAAPRTSSYGTQASNTNHNKTVRR